jgi:poly-beta-hydroxyalkanoate depolymerase
MNVFDRGDAMGKNDSFDKDFDTSTRKYQEIKYNIMHSSHPKTINIRKDVIFESDFTRIK